jgi:hypothetical protein
MAGTNTLSGSYTTLRDGGVVYDYDVTWWRLPGLRLHCSARIKRQGLDPLTIDRSILLTAGANIEHALRKLVEHAIEHLTRAER